jgi:hypothetical protein
MNEFDEVKEQTYVEPESIKPSRDLEDPHFYDGGKSSQEEYSELAKSVPDVRERLENGESIEDLKNNEELGDCTKAYFEKPLQVYENEDGYQLIDDGNHRLKAAQDEGVEIPVDIVERTESETTSDFDNYDMNEEKFEFAAGFDRDSFVEANYDANKDIDPNIEEETNKDLYANELIEDGNSVEEAYAAINEEELSENSEYLVSEEALYAAAEGAANPSLAAEIASTMGPEGIGSDAYQAAYNYAEVVAPAAAEGMMEEASRMEGIIPESDIYAMKTEMSLQDESNVIKDYNEDENGN